MVLDADSSTGSTALGMLLLKNADNDTVVASIALDLKTHHVFSIGTEQNDPVPRTDKNPNPRPKPVLSTFELLEIGKWAARSGRGPFHESLTCT